MKPSDSSFSGEKVLVTGASGFIGSHLCSRLLENEAEVYAVSRETQNAENGLHWWQGDLAEMEEVRELIETTKPDLIFHLAGCVAGARDLSLVTPTFRSNLMSTVNLLTVAAENGCGRIVLPNSMEEPEFTDRTAVPSSPYAVTKWASSAYGRMFHALFELPVVILRVFMVYGPAQRDVRKLIPYSILSFLKGETPRFTSGQRQVDWIYVDDVVSALLVAARKSGIEGLTIDVGSGNLVQVRTIVEILARLLNPEVKPLFGTLSERPLEQERVADSATAEATLGWKAITPLSEGLKRTMEWYRQELNAGELS